MQGSKDWLDTKRDFIDEVDNLVRDGESEMFDKIPTELHEEIKTFVNEVANLPQTTLKPSQREQSD